MVWIIQIAETRNMHLILMNCKARDSMKASSGTCAIYERVDQMTQIHQYLELFVFFFQWVI